MAELILHCFISAIPLSIVFFRDKIKIKDFLLFILIFLLGLVFSFFNIVFYGHKQAALGHNIDIGSLILIGFTGFVYVIVLPLLFIFYKRK